MTHAEQMAARRKALLARARCLRQDAEEAGRTPHGDRLHFRALAAQALANGQRAVAKALVIRAKGAVS